MPLLSLLRQHRQMTNLSSARAHWNRQKWMRSQQKGAHGRRSRSSNPTLPSFGHTGGSSRIGAASANTVAPILVTAGASPSPSTNSAVAISMMRFNTVCCVLEEDARALCTANFHALNGKQCHYCHHCHSAATVVTALLPLLMGLTAMIFSPASSAIVAGPVGKSEGVTAPGLALILPLHLLWDCHSATTCPPRCHHCCP